MPSILNITAPPATSALTTLTTARLEVGASDTGDDAYLNLLIARASAGVQSWIGRQLGVQTATETFRSRSGNHSGYPLYSFGHSASQFSPQPLIATLIPILTIASIIEDGGTPLVVNTDYEVESHTGLLWRLSGGVRTAWSASAVVMTYTAGYTLPQDTGTVTLPADIEGATLALLRNAYFMRGQDPTIILEVTEGLGRTGYNPKGPSSGLDDDIKQTLAPYRSLAYS